MAARAVVFVGPSLAGEAVHNPRFVFLPPAKRGDIAAAVSAGATHVGLIDGVFLQSRAVPPSEIHRVASLGVARLYGAASLGALRAAECPQAIVGIGEIYAGFASGALTDDDEVAQTYDPESFDTIAVPLVRMRETMRLAEERLLVSPDAARAIVADIKAWSFDERVRGRLVVCIARHVEERSVPSVLRILDAPESDIKCRDARLLLARMELDLAAG